MKTMNKSKLIIGIIAILIILTIGYFIISNHIEQVKLTSYNQGVIDVAIGQTQNQAILLVSDDQIVSVPLQEICNS